MKVSELEGAELAKYEKYQPQRQAKTTHGMKSTPTYLSWERMKQRCLNKNHDRYPLYGGRGITICDEWLSFDKFYEEMGDRPDGCSLDRIDSNDGYYKKNCRWATQKEQCRNKRNNTLITCNGVTKCLVEWSEELGIGRTTIKWRLDHGWPVERALS